MLRNVSHNSSTINQSADFYEIHSNIECEITSKLV